MAWFTRGFINLDRRMTATMLKSSIVATAGEAYFSPGQLGGCWRKKISARVDSQAATRSENIPARIPIPQKAR